MKKDVKRKVFFYGSLLLLILLSIVTILPFAAAVFGGLILAFVFHPLYKKLPGGKRVRALTIVLITILIIVLPTMFLITKVTTEANVAYITTQQAILNAKNSCDGCFFQKVLDDPQVKYYLNDSIGKISNAVIDKAAEIFVSLPAFVISIFLMMVSLFYFLKDDERILKKIDKLVPLNTNSKKRIFSQFEGMTKSVVYGYLVSAILQGVVALIGFSLVNLIHGSTLIYAPILFAFLLTLLSLLPMIGSGFVWVPLTLYLMLRTYSTGDTFGLGLSIGLLIYCAVIVSNIDNVIRPLLTGAKAKVHPLVVFVGIFGGLYMFGLMGMFIGPIILALLLTYLKIYEEGLI